MGLDVDAGDGTKAEAGSKPLSDEADLFLLDAFDLRRVLVPVAAAELDDWSCFLILARGDWLLALRPDDVDRLDLLLLPPDSTLVLDRRLCPFLSLDRDDFWPDD